MLKSSPVAIFCIIATEFCERFSFCGLRTILSLYLRNVLCLHENTATVVYHVFIMMCYTMPLVGAVLADNYLGRYSVILYFSIVYLLGSILTCCAAIPPLKLSPMWSSMIGLCLIAAGSGGIKPCVAAFGGDQFRLPQEGAKLQRFFSAFYCTVNLGGCVGMVLTPLLRKRVACFGDDSCYALGFGLPTALMVLSILIFIAGKPWYHIKLPKNNVTLQFLSCAWYAVRKRLRRDEPPKEHWLDHSVERYGRQLVADMKVVCGIMYLYLPVPLFWSLFDQQVTARCAETCAARNMKNYIATEQIALAERLFQPILIAQNSEDEINMHFMDPNSFTKSLTGKARMKVVYIGEAGSNRNVSVTIDSGKHVNDVFYTSDEPADDVGESAYMCITPGRFSWRLKSTDGGEMDAHGAGYVHTGGVYVLCARQRDGRLDSVALHAPNPPNELHLGWIAPQYLLLSVAEIMFAVSGLEFSFTQAPKSMKTITIAAWYVSVAFGNLLVIMVTQSRIFESQATEFFVYAALLACGMLTFLKLTRGYQPPSPGNDGSSSEGSPLLRHKARVVSIRSLVSSGPPTTPSSSDSSEEEGRLCAPSPVLLRPYDFYSSKG